MTAKIRWTREEVEKFIQRCAVQRAMMVSMELSAEIANSEMPRPRPKSALPGLILMHRETINRLAGALTVKKPMPAIVVKDIGSAVRVSAQELVSNIMGMMTTEIEALIDAEIVKLQTAVAKKVKLLKSTIPHSIDVPKVMIIGIMGDQANSIAHEFGNMLDMRFMKSDEGSIPQISTQAKHVDHVLLLTKFVSHSQQNAVRDHEGLVFISGGMSQLRDVLTEIACS